MTTTTVQVQDVPIYRSGVGNVVALASVTVKPRIDGQLERVAFVEGQDVKAGQLLAQIDPRTLEAQLAQAQAQKARDEAQLGNARVDLKRYTGLFADDAATQQQLDTQKALVAQLEAAVKTDDAQINFAQVQLGFTRIVAPISGRVGARLVDAGNIVHAADPGGLVVINQIDPITVLFTLPEEAFQDINHALHASAEPLQVIAYPRDGKEKLGAGKLILLNNQIDTTTGTVQLKGSFANPGHALWPGQYVNVRLVLRHDPQRADGARRSGAAQPGRHLRLGRRRRQQGREPAGARRPDRGRHRGDRERACRRAARRRRRPVPGSGRRRRRRVGASRERAGERGVGSRIEHRRREPARDREWKQAMNISAAFIARPIGTTLLALALLLVGVAVFPLLPVAPLPQVDFPTIQVSANLPGASPETMASNVAQPLERQFSLIAGLSQMTSTSGIGSTQITLQFDLNRSIDAAALDVQAAINASTGQLPANLPSPPTFRKINPADSPIMLLTVQSKTLPLIQVNDYADNILAQQISQISGVGLVNIGGAQKPAVRVQVDPTKIAALGMSLEDIRGVIATDLGQPAQGHDRRRDAELHRLHQRPAAQGRAVERRRSSPTSNGAPIRVRDIGVAVDAPENNKVAAWAYAGAAAPDERHRRTAAASCSSSPSSRAPT